MAHSRSSMKALAQGPSVALRPANRDVGVLFGEIRAHDNRLRALDSLLAPRTIAVVGASETNRRSVLAITNLRQRGYEGPIYPVHPHHSEVMGIKCYPSPMAVPGAIDLALVLVGRDRVAGALRECHAAHVRAAVVNADGYAESTEVGGIQRQEELVELVRKGGLLLCGPNCLGFVNVAAKTAAFCGPLDSSILPGGLAIISQSGGNCCSLIEAAYDRHVGVSYAISTGNEATLGLCDYLDYVVEDVNTSVICVFSEGVAQSRRFLESARRAIRARKPIVLIRLGRSAEGREAALAHTGTLAGPDEVVDAVLARVGVLQATSLDEALDKCLLFAQLPRERWPQGADIAVTTQGGGAAGVFVDLAGDYGIKLPTLPDTIREELERVCPQGMRIRNPFDVPSVHRRSRPEVVTTFVDACARDMTYDAVVMVLRSLGEERIGAVASLRPALNAGGTPLIVTTPTATTLPEAAREVLSRSSVAIVPGFERCMRSIDAAARYAIVREPPRRMRRRKVREDLWDAVLAASAAEKKVLDPFLSYALLEQYDLPVVRQAIAPSADFAISFARDIGPVALKAVGEAIPHKTELRALRLGLRTPEEIEAAFAELSGRFRGVHSGLPPVSIVVQEMVMGAAEIYLGVSNEYPEYPPAVLVGLGGIFLEVFDDVAVRLAPLDSRDAREMLQSLRSFPILSGVRGRGPMDIGSLVGAMVALSDLALEFEEVIAEIDINPAMVLADGGGMKIVDVLMVLRERNITGVKHRTREMSASRVAPPRLRQRRAREGESSSAEESSSARKGKKE